MYSVDKSKIENAIRDILEAIGEDPNREGLLDTPSRVAKMYEEIFSGIHKDPREHLKILFKSEEHEELVLVKDIPFYSCCEHHLVPFFGKVHIAYIPNGRVVGLSKLARCVEVYSKKPQLQERLTKEIADAIMEYLDAKGVMVVVEGEHMCMTMRGVKKPGARTVTTTYRGKFLDNESLKNDVFRMISM